MKLKRIIAFLIFFFVIAFLFLGVRKFYGNQNHDSRSNVTTVEKNNTPNALPEIAEIQQNNASTPQENQPFQPPLERAGERVTKKPFGIFITPQNSPVQPERFSGYHTGADFEIFPEELNSDVEVKAICSGKLLASRTAGGYGGLAVESCELNNQSITVVYGHINISSVKFKTGDQIKSGDIIALLGTNKSTETNGERKHLHLAVHKGSGIDIRGYVQNQSELSRWADPCNLQSVCQ
ncbi:MAG: M23 family metallopeptidase [Patescibacteria group bacterium]|nr:M23 family metallopeptidase [Patescibacteria group bacterium]